MPPRSRQLESEFQKVRTDRPSLTEEQARLGQEAGLGERRTALEDVRRNVLSTQKTLRGVPEATTARSRRLGGPVTQAALNRLTTAAQEPLSQQLQRFGESEQFERQGIQGTQEDIARQLQLIQTGRTETGEDFRRRIAQAREDELAKRQEEFALRQIQANQALGFAQLKSQQESDTTLNDLISQFFGGAGEEVAGAATGPAAPTDLASRLGFKGGAVTGEGFAPKLGLTEQFGGIGKNILDLFGFRGGTEDIRAKKRQVEDEALRRKFGLSSEPAGISGAF